MACDWCPESGGVCIVCGRVDGYRKRRNALVITLVCGVGLFVLVVAAIILSQLDR